MGSGEGEGRGGTQDSWMNFMRGKTRADEKWALFDIVECDEDNQKVLHRHRTAEHKMDLNPVVDFPDCQIIQVPVTASVEYSSIIHTDRIFCTLSKKTKQKKSKA